MENLQTNEIVRKITDAIEQLDIYNEMLDMRLNYLATNFEIKDSHAYEKLRDANADIQRYIHCLKNSAIDYMVYINKPF